MQLKSRRDPKALIKIKMNAAVSSFQETKCRGLFNTSLWIAEWLPCIGLTNVQVNASFDLEYETGYSYFLNKEYSKCWNYLLSKQLSSKTLFLKLYSYYLVILVFDRSGEKN